MEILTELPNYLQQAASTGIPGLDHLLHGGWPANRFHLIEGDPGTGKTTFALQFLLAGVNDGETGLFISLTESFEELNDICDSHGWPSDGLIFFDVSAPIENPSREAQYTIFLPTEVELAAAIQRIMNEVRRTNPRRVVFDSLSELRLLACDPLRFWQQILALKKFFAARQCTVLLLDQDADDKSALQVHTICHGVILLQNRMTNFGSPQRKLRIIKMRGMDCRGAEIDFEIDKSGVHVYESPTCVAEAPLLTGSLVQSGLKELDDLFCGGLLRGTSTLLVGPSGSGKSTIAAIYASAAASRGEKSVFYIFEESINTFRRRADAMNTGFAKYMAEGLISVIQMNPAELSAGKFSDTIREAVQSGDVTTVVIDSLNGYLSTMVAEKLLLLHLHDLLAHLRDKGVSTFITVAQTGFIGDALQSPVEVSYLSDSVLLFRFFESNGKVRRALSVPKKRDGAHEDTIRELSFTDFGPKVGKPLTGMQGVLSGFPSHVMSSAGA